jgi:PKD repeat protein
MKQLLYLVMSLIIIAAIIPVTSATVVTLHWEGGLPDVWMTNSTWFTETEMCSTLAECTAYCSGRSAITPIYSGSAIASRTKSYINSSGWYVPSGTDSTTLHCTDAHNGCTYTFNSANISGVAHTINCKNEGGSLQDNYLWRTLSRPYPVLIINFTGSPLNGSAPLTVGFNVSNATGMSSLTKYWDFGDGHAETSTADATSHIYQTEGTFTVKLLYYDYSGDLVSVQKNNYITVGAPNATATTHAVARDLYTGFAINGAQVDMYDVENISWTNTTAINGEGSITTLLGHTINIWGSATGYEDDNLQGVPAVDGGYYSLLLRPTNLTTYNSTPGNLTLAVTVQDLQIPHQTLSGAEVTAAWGAQYASGTSNAAGSVFFTVPNNTAIHLSAFKSGYASGSSTHITGTANGGSTMETAIVYIGTDYVTPVPSVTATTGPGGTVPQTVDPYPCIGDGSPADTANCQRKQGSMAADLISYGPDLVKFFIMLTFTGGLMLLLKR